MRRLQLEVLARWRAHLADRELSSGRYDDAERLVAEAMRLMKDSTGADPVHEIVLLNRLGMIHKYQGRFSEGRRAYRRALRVCRNVVVFLIPGCTLVLVRIPAC